MKNWFEELENTCVDYASDYLEKIEESDETERFNSNRKKSREVARVRNLRFKANQIKRFYASVWKPNSSGDEEEVKDLIKISHTLTNYYVDTPDKPTHIKRIEGEHNYYTWAGPKWNKFKRRYTNRHIRRNKTFEPISKSKTVFKENGPRSFD